MHLNELPMNLQHEAFKPVKIHKLAASLFEQQDLKNVKKVATFSPETILYSISHKS